MRAVYRPRGSVIFEYGDTGSEMYLILDGSVSLKVPVTMEGSFSQEEVFRFMIEYCEEIDWDGWKQALIQGETGSGGSLEFQSQEKIEALLGKIRDGIKYQMGKLHRSTKKNISTNIKEMISLKLAEKKIFVPSALHGMLSDKKTGG